MAIAVYLRLTVRYEKQIRISRVFEELFYGLGVIKTWGKLISAIDSYSKTIPQTGILLKIKKNEPRQGHSSKSNFKDVERTSQTEGHGYNE